MGGSGMADEDGFQFLGQEDADPGGEPGQGEDPAPESLTEDVVWAEIQKLIDANPGSILAQFVRSEQDRDRRMEPIRKAFIDASKKK